MRGLAMMVALVGCGRVGFDASREDASASVDDTRAASIDASDCVTVTFDGPPTSLVPKRGTWSVGGGLLRMDTTGQLNQGSELHTVGGTFVGRATAVEVVQPAQQPQVWTGIGWHITGGATHLYILEGELRFLSSNGGTAVAAYDPARHRWLRMRETNGALLAETSGDGVSWAVHGMVVAPSPSELVDAHFDVSVESTIMNVGPDYALFDNFIDCVR